MNISENSAVLKYDGMSIGT